MSPISKLVDTVSLMIAKVIVRVTRRESNIPPPQPPPPAPTGNPPWDPEGKHPPGIDPDDGEDADKDV